MRKNPARHRAVIQALREARLVGPCRRSLQLRAYDREEPASSLITRNAASMGSKKCAPEEGTHSIYSGSLMDAIQAYEASLNRGFSAERALRRATALLAEDESLPAEQARALLSATLEELARARHARCAPVDADDAGEDEGT